MLANGKSSTGILIAGWNRLQELDREIKKDTKNTLYALAKREGVHYGRLQTLVAKGTKPEEAVCILLKRPIQLSFNFQSWLTLN